MPDARDSRNRLLGASLAIALLACRAGTVADAESRGDVAWLDANGSPEAVAAIGRIADSDTRAVDTLSARSATDVNAYIAAWNATVRGASWGPTLLRAGLADPARAESAASAMKRQDGHLAALVPDLESALQRTSASAHNGAVASVLASAGSTAAPSVQRRLEDPATRGAMCRGLGSPDASADARRVLMSVPPASRDNESCVGAVLRIATENAAALDWLATKAEPGLLSAAGRSDEFPCARLKPLWTAALVSRPAAVHTGITVPLTNAIKRCAPQMDSVMSDAIIRLPATHGLIVAAIDPFGGETADMKATCDALRTVASSGRESAIVRERASDALAHGCRVTR